MLLKTQPVFFLTGPNEAFRPKAGASFSFISCNTSFVYRPFDFAQDKHTINVSPLRRSACYSEAAAKAGP